jgi:hypothetical protein
MKNLNKINVIIFSYKRAILLESCIDSIIKNCNNINFPINVIYRYDSNHHKSYLKIKKIYGERVKIWKRNNVNIFWNLALFLRPLNLIWAIKWIKIITSYSNFKKIFEKILSKLSSPFVMLCTDDTIFIKKNYVNYNILNLIKNDGKKKWFRPNFGLDIYNSKKVKYINKNRNITWNATDENISFFMKYNFQIEGSIYNRLSLLKFVKPFIYYNPTTLEAIGYKEAKYRKYFNEMIAPLTRSALTLELNSVQTDTKLRLNDRPQFNSEHLARCFLKGYKLRFKLNKKYIKFINEFGNKRAIPKKLFLKFKNKKKEISKITF